MTDTSRATTLSPAKQALLRRRLQGLGTGAGRGIPRRPPGPAPLSPVQHGMWITQQFLETGALYNVPRVLRITGPVDVGALRAALDALTERHEILRTTYPDPASPTQHVNPPGPVVLRRTDLRDLPAAGRWDEAMRLAYEEISAPFDLAAGPVFRAHLIDLDLDSRMLVLNVHHIATDDWSCTLLLRELDQIYAAVAAGRRPDLQPLPIQYADYSHWQRERLSGGLDQRQLDYWRTALESTPHVLELPTDRPRPTTPSHLGDVARHTLTPELSASIRALATSNGVTVYTVLLTVFSLVLRHYCGQRRFAVGTLLSGRNVADTEHLLGLFANSVALPMDLPGDLAFSELLGRANKSVLAAFDHQDVTFEQVVSAVRADRSAVRNPVYQVLFQCLEAAERASELPGLRARPVGIVELTAKVDLTLNAINGPETIDLKLNYATDLFDATTANRLLSYVVTLAGNVVARPDAVVTSAMMTSARERETLTRDWPVNTADYPGADRYPLGRTFVDLFRAQAEATPSAIAVSCGEQSLTYGELGELTDQLAAGLRTMGVWPGQAVGVALPRSAEMVAAVLGVLKAGATYVALDPGYPAARLAFMVGDAGARMVIVAEDLPALRAEGTARLVPFDGLLGDPRQPAPPGPSSSDLAYIMYTSGSTGQPKGVEISHEGLTNLLSGVRDLLGAGPRDTWLLLTSLSFDPSTLELFVPLMTGGKVVVAPESARLDGAEQAQVIRDHGVTHVQATPSGWRLLLGAGFDSPLELAITVGEALPESLARQIRQRAARLVNAYGPTEVTVYATYADVPASGSPVLIGRPAANAQVYLLDGSLDPVPLGALGEICVGGVGVARAYHGRPGLTARRFVPDPFGPPGSRLYRTGDRARYLPSGELDLQGRIDNQVKIRGHRVEPGEIEARLLAHQAVAQAAVVARPGPGGGPQLSGYVLAANGTPGLEQELRRHLAESLPGYMVPAQFAVLDRMPLTPTGKIDRKALPVIDRPATGTDPSDAAATDAERALAQVWSSVLGRDQVGRHDNFFDIGGDSVLAIYVVAGARAAGLTITPRQVLTQQTLAGLAAVAVQASPEGDETPPADLAGFDPEAVEQVYPLSPLQTGMVFHTLFEPESTDYVVQFVYSLDGSPDMSVLQQAWDFVVRRHPVLRTTFAWDPEPIQVVHREATIALRHLDWRDVPMTGVPQRLSDHLAAERARGVDLEQRPPRRLDVIRLADGTCRMIWHGHHVLLDGWSLRLVLDEVRTAYQALRATGTLPRLPEPVAFRRYVDWLRSHDPAEATAYWRGELSDVAAPTPLTILRPERGDSKGATNQEVALLHAEVPSHVSARLREIAREHRITVGSVAHAAWGLLLSRYGGGEDVVFGSTTSGRSGGLPGVERTVGLLINTLPLRLKARPGDKVSDWLRAVHDRLLVHRDFEHCSLVDVQRQSQVPAGKRLFDTILMFENHAGRRGPDESGLGLKAVHTMEQTGYPLVLNVGLHDELLLRLDYQPARVPADVAERLVAHYQLLLEQLTMPSDVRLADLAPLPQTEWDSVVHAFNDTRAPYPSDLCLHELFERQADRTPDAVAVMFDAEAVSYRELDERANRLARYLREFGVVPESLVGICLQRSVNSAVAVLAVLKAGAAYVPLDPDYPADRLEFMLADTATPVVLTQNALADRLSGHTVVCLDDPADAARIDRFEPGRLSRVARPGNLSYVIYTSGSTGRPKGTLIRHQGIVNYVWWMAANFPLAQGDKVLQLANLSFDISVYEMFWPWSGGAAVILARPDGYKDPQYIADMMTRENVTAAHVVPSMLRALLPLTADRPLPLRWLFASAEALTLDVVREWQNRCPDTELLNLYGATEVSVDSTAWSCRSSADHVSVGSPIANTRVYVLDRSGDPVPIGVAGEACLAGDSVGRGYHGRPGLTARRFVPDPFGPPGARLYRTGDLIRWAVDGTLEFLGRLDHQVKIRGFRVELGEVEAALETHSQVNQAVLVARDEAAGPKRLVAYVVPSGETAPTTSELRSHLQARLPDYMVPAAFVMLSALPLNPNGKVDRKALPAPEGARPDLRAQFVAPRTSAEKVLAEVWSEVLGVTDIGVHDNFFDLGGDSILSIQVMVSARRAGLALTPRQMFADPTIAQLASTVEGSALPAAVHAEQDVVTGDVPLTPIQRWFTNLEWPHDHYNQSVRLRWSSTIAEEPLRQALTALIRHHDALRLRLDPQSGHQYLAAPGSTDVLWVVNLHGLPPGRIDQEVEQAADRLHNSLDLRSGPLLRAMVLRYGDRPDELIITVHHVAVDTVSWGILLEDLAAAYRQLHDGEPLELPAKTTSFRYWAESLAGYASSEDFAAEAAYWRMPVPVSGVLPVDHPGGRNCQSSSATVRRDLDAAHTEALLRSAHTAYRTRVNDLLVTALAQTLAGCSGNPNVHIDLEGHGREPLFDDVDLTRTVGWFTTIHPVRIQVPADPGGGIKTVKQHLRSTPRHGIGHGIAQVDSPPAAVSFNYHGQTRMAQPAGLFVRLDSVPGASRAATGIRPYQIEVNAVVVDGVFRVMWTYSTDLHREETVGSLADEFISRLAALLDHCVGRHVAASARDLLSRLSPGVPTTRLCLQRHHVPGASIALAADGEVVGAWGEGFACPGVAVGPDTVFQAGSVSKHVTALAVLRLVEDGVLDLSADVNEYLRSWRLAGGVTLRSLLSHTAGLTEDDFGGLGAVHPSGPIPGVLDVLTGRAPARTAPVRCESPFAGRFRYSGNNYVVIEQVLVDVTGQPFPQLMRDLVFSPLAMRDSHYGSSSCHPRAVGHNVDGTPVDGGWRVYPSATGGLWTSARDIAQVSAEIQRAHSDKGAILSSWAAHELLIPVSGTYGLGTVVRAPWFGHSGETAGFRAHAATDLETGTGLVVLTNGDSGMDFVVDLLVQLDVGLRVWMDRETS
ncbi:amino acid adenylation domain-containing protein [Actinocrispum sp. NPDC049592]|uniref:amino acid adenylation domain-containing protein n=1 Tax=Actinocrispum sp. NPDC049592 TaxID=3154835 RepID=UPI0034490A84